MELKLVLASLKPLVKDSISSTTSWTLIIGASGALFLRVPVSWDLDVLDFWISRLPRVDRVSKGRRSAIVDSSASCFYSDFMAPPGKTKRTMQVVYSSPSLPGNSFPQQNMNDQAVKQWTQL